MAPDPNCCRSPMLGGGILTEETKNNDLGKGIGLTKEERGREG